MPIATPADGHGLTLTYTGFAANVVGVTGPNFSRESIDKTHMGTVAWKEFMPGDLVDPGEIGVELEFDSQALPPITGAASDLVVVWGNAETLKTWTCTAFMTAFSVSGGATGARMMASATFKLSGAPVVS